MNVNKIANTRAVTKKLTKLKSDITKSALFGDCEGFKNAKIKYSKEAVKNFELAKSIKTKTVTAPLFSKWGFNMLKVCIYDLFRKKTPEEKLYKRMCEEDYFIKQQK